MVIYIENFTQREKMLRLREQLLAVEEGRIHGVADHTLKEVSAYLDHVISETCRTVRKDTKASFLSGWFTQTQDDCLRKV